MKSTPKAGLLSRHNNLLWRSFLVIIFLGVIASFVKIGVALLDIHSGESRSMRYSVVPAEVPAVRLIALTFDDGPHPEYTPKILDILDCFGAKATFFTVGKMAAKYPELVKEIDRRGHEIGNHTYEHRLLTELSKSETLAELERDEQEIYSVIGRRPEVFRPPSGRYNKGTVEAAASMGLSTVLWTNYSDYGAMRSSDVISNVMTDPKDGDIILLHSGIDSTLLALPVILQQLSGRNFGFVTVSALIARNGKGVLTPGLLRSVRPFTPLTK